MKTFNSVYDGKDVIGQARTGTGKTFSFAVPLVEKLQSGAEDRRRGRAPKVTLHTLPEVLYCITGSCCKQVLLKYHEIHRAAQKCTRENAAVLHCKKGFLV